MGKIRVSADTSALLSLKLCNCLEDTLRFFQYSIGRKIEEELKEISETNDKLGIAARSVLKRVEKEIELVETKEFEEGELEALWIYKNKGADLLVSDDIEFVKSHREEAHFSTLLLIVLVKKNIITKTELIKRLEEVFEKRNWDKNNLIYISTISELKQL